ncbi:helicase HerA-like domain-containing protein [Camelimonas abortus]|uniref:Helicase HerA-like domain-containing protein n=1 Tax=Camelimonas abortus TaxID=1017184 RepID=A0ABV7LHA7_9HYPH
MADDGYVLIGFTSSPDHEPQMLDLRLANRHGLVAGATGTGKTVTLQVLAEGLSRAGVAVFAADIKGDLSGVSQMGDAQPHFVRRAQEFGFDYTPEQFPVVFWDLFGEQGHPVRASIDDMGPLLVSRLLELNDTQEGVLNIAFRVAREQQIPLVDLADLRALLVHVGRNAKTLAQTYGNIATQSVGAIQRQLLVLENQGADRFFGAPAFDINDLLRVDPASGRGVINILAADRLMNSPRLYATFLLWMLSSLFDRLPEIGDPPRPRLAFFFDEAHLLFSDAPKALLDQIERVVRLIRSKGVGVYFVTQNPLDVPETVLAQLGNRVQHALRAFTPRDRKAVRAAADTFRQNPAFDAAEVITELAVGEALVSVLEGRGTPSVVQRTLVAPPSAKVGAITPAQRQAVIAASPFPASRFAPQPRQTAQQRIAELEAAAAPPQEAGEDGGGGGGLLDSVLEGALGGGKGRRKQSITEKVISTAASSAARRIGTKIANVLLKSLFGGK